MKIFIEELNKDISKLKHISKQKSKQYYFVFNIECIIAVGLIGDRHYQLRQPIGTILPHDRLSGTLGQHRSYDHVGPE